MVALEQVLAEALCAHHSKNRLVLPQAHLVVDHLSSGEVAPCGSCKAASQVVAKALRSSGLVKSKA